MNMLVAMHAQATLSLSANDLPAPVKPPLGLFNMPGGTAGLNEEIAAGTRPTVEPTTGAVVAPPFSSLATPATDPTTAGMAADVAAAVSRAMEPQEEEGGAVAAGGSRVFGGGTAGAYERGGVQVGAAGISGPEAGSAVEQVVESGFGSGAGLE